MNGHRCLENSNKLYTPAGKCDDKTQFKDIIEASMISNNEIFNNNSTISPVTYMIARKISIS